MRFLRPPAATMPFRLAQELEEHFAVIEKLLAAGRRVGELEKLARKARKVGHDDIAHKAEENARKAISIIKGSYSKSIQTISGYLRIPIIAAIGTWLADGLLGPLQ